MATSWPILIIMIGSTLAASLYSFEREELLSSLAGECLCVYCSVRRSSPQTIRYLIKSICKFVVGTNFCSSLLLSEEMRISVNELAKIYTERKDLGVNGNVDACCRSHYDCSRAKFETNTTNNSKHWDCECEAKFRTCLRKVNTPLSSELGFGRSVYVKQCISKDYPIVKCVQYEEFLNPSHRFEGSPNKRDSEANYARCLQYQFDETQPKKIQMFDLPFNYSGLSTNEIQRLKRNHGIRNFLHRVHGFAGMLHTITKDIRSLHRNFNF